MVKCTEHEHDLVVCDAIFFVTYQTTWLQISVDDICSIHCPRNLMSVTPVWKRQFI